MICYDYCVDDPVTMNDPMGLFPQFLALLTGGGGTLGIGAGGVYGAAKATDTIKSSQDGRHRGKIIKGATHAARLAEGYSVPAPPAPYLQSYAGTLAYLMEKLYREKFDK